MSRPRPGGATIRYHRGGRPQPPSIGTRRTTIQGDPGNTGGETGSPMTPMPLPHRSVPSEMIMIDRMGSDRPDSFR